VTRGGGGKKREKKYSEKTCDRGVNYYSGGSTIHLKYSGGRANSDKEGVKNHLRGRNEKA